jgi:hypothetical protein
MTDPYELTFELVRAANNSNRLSEADARRLLGRAVICIRDMREQIDFPNIGTPKDAVISLQTSAIAIGLSPRTPAQITVALLDAAGMIRDLGILIETARLDQRAKMS